MTVHLTLSTNYDVILLIHRLVASAFIPTDDEHLQVNHKNGIKTDNDISNLEWVTARENMVHSYETGLHKIGFGEDSNNPKISLSQAKKICKLLEENELTLNEIAEKVGTSRNIVYNIKHKKSWTNISSKYIIENHKIRADGVNRATSEIVHCICKELEKNELHLTEIAEKFGVSIHTVREIRKGKTHKDISCKYDISKYNVLPHYYKSDIKLVRKICEYLQNTNMSIADISRTLDVPYDITLKILHNVSWKNISKNYDFSNRNA